MSFQIERRSPSFALLGCTSSASYALAAVPRNGVTGPPSSEQLLIVDDDGVPVLWKVAPPPPPSTKIDNKRGDVALIYPVRAGHFMSIHEVDIQPRGERYRQNFTVIFVSFPRKFYFIFLNNNQRTTTVVQCVELYSYSFVQQ